MDGAYFPAECLSELGATGAADFVHAVLRRQDPDGGGECAGDFSGSGVPSGEGSHQRHA